MPRWTKLQFTFVWLGCSDLVPTKKHIKALGDLTGYPPSVIERWFGTKMRSGSLSQDDSAYGTRLTASTSFTAHGQEHLVTADASAATTCEITTFGSHYSDWMPSFGPPTVSMAPQTWLDPVTSSASISQERSVDTGETLAVEATTVEDQRGVREIALARAIFRGRDRQGRLGQKCKE